MMASARRLLVTDSDHFAGPAAVDRFRAGGDTVVAHPGPLRPREEVAELAANDGPFDVVVANLDTPIGVASIAEHTDEVISGLLDRLVRPLFWLFAECLPPMYAAGDGAVVATSATAICSSSHPIAGYETARAAQLKLV